MKKVIGLILVSLISWQQFLHKVVIVRERREIPLNVVKK